ncbi:MAG: 2-amino-4-hydroxy-6-hydroxymethyldihydropteridine diphosphokinase [Elusimicrobia bacterium RIFOXYB2_FULL_48_7]|nr:MAG: 2-amino-4-hydroxy-6-hydroxymethyldihydropteridine diphosphokinase [Elusimicrobia bacterium RIFOXYB2_FULL_48_7]
MLKAYIGVGTNLGNKRKNILNALELLNSNEKIVINRCSSIYRTKPWGFKKQPGFFNAVWEIETGLSPHKLLSALKHIEKKMGRRKTFRWGPRIIDMDILTYANKKLRTKTLVIPHPEMNKRDFVLKPLKEISRNSFEQGAKS